MSRPHTHSGNSKPIFGAIAAGFLVATAFYKAGMGAWGSILLGRATWEVLRSVVLLVGWQAVSAYLYQDPGVVHHLLQIGAGFWLLFCATLAQG